MDTEEPVSDQRESSRLTTADLVLAAIKEKQARLDFVHMRRQDPFRTTAMRLKCGDGEAAAQQAAEPQHRKQLKSLQC